MKNRLVTMRQTNRGVSVAFLVPPARSPLDAPTKVSAPVIELEQDAVTVEVEAGPAPIVEDAATPAQENPQQAYRTFQLIPHANVKNENIEHFTKVIDDSYREIWQRWSNGRAEDPDRIFFETVLEPQRFRTYITTNTSLTNRSSSTLAPSGGT